MDIDNSKMVYFGNTIRDSSLKDLIIFKAVEYGFDKQKIIPELASKMAQDGDYAVYLEYPEEPKELVVWQVKKGRTIEPKKFGDRQQDIIEYDELDRIKL